jgi:fibronectin-binding autotransporter adhesin
VQFLGGKFELAGASDYTGGTVLRGSSTTTDTIVTLDTMDALGASTSPIIGGAAASGGPTIRPLGVLSFKASGTFSHPVISEAGGSVYFDAPGQTVTLDQPMTGPGLIEFGYTYTPTTPGTFHLAAKSTNTGPTYISPSSTSVVLDTDDAISSKWVFLTNGTLDLNGHDQTLGSIVGLYNGTSTKAKIIISEGHTLTVGADNLDANWYAASYGSGYQGILTGGGGLTKIGTGWQPINGIYDTTDLPYTGPTKVKGGTLQFSGDIRALQGTSDVTIDAGATLLIAATKAASGNVAPVFDKPISGGGTLEKYGAAAETLELTATNTYTGSTFITGGTLIASSDANLGATVAPVRFSTQNGSNSVLQLKSPLTLTHDIRLESGTGTIDTLANDVTATGTISGPANFAKSGTGTLTVNTSNALAGAVTVNAGTLQLAASQRFGALNVGDASTAQLTASGDKVLSTAAVAFGSTGKLDLTDNKLIVTTAGATGSWTGSNYDGVTGQVATARGDGTWNGASGITTSVASGKLTTLGVAKAGDVKGIGDDETATFAGQTVHGSDTLVMFTYGGDANLDGKINIDDYGRIDSNVGFNGTVHGWYNGDFNYDGSINIDDYGIIDSNIGIQGPPISTDAVAAVAAAPAALAGVTAVPEPTSLARLGLAASCLGARRRRRR